MSKRILITSALPYANGYIHLGHCSGAYLTADIWARYARLRGEDVLYVCGSDEHGVAITIAAEKEKVSPKDIIDKYHSSNKESFEKFGMSFDIFSRTSNEDHKDTALDFFCDFLKKDLLVEKEEEQFYDAKAQMFLPDRYVEGICPNCGHDHARGDQCDFCGAYYDQLELKNPVSLVSGDTPVARKTTHWYMQFNRFQKFLEDYIESHKGDWKDNVLQQSRSWLRQGFSERAITRDLSWGISLEGIPGLPPEKIKGKVLYVWFEAVLGYITATKEKMTELEKAGKAVADDWKKWWKSPDTRYLAFIGKDNIVFHALIFPAMLHARGEGYILPDNVPANEFLNLEGEKFSKSRNWSIELREFEKDFPDDNYISALRYTLAMNFPETKDADFTWKDFQTRNNNELAAIFGNFINRSFKFLHKSFEGKIPELSGKYADFAAQASKLRHEIKTGKTAQAEDYSVFNQNDYALLTSVYGGIEKISANYNAFRFRDALTETMNVARATNKYFNDEIPWKVIKVSPEDCAKTLRVCLECSKALAILFAPVIPFTSKRIFEYLGIETETGEANAGSDNKHDYWSDALDFSLKAGSNVADPQILFAHIDTEQIQPQIDKLGKKQ